MITIKQIQFFLIVILNTRTFFIQTLLCSFENDKDITSYRDTINSGATFYLDTQRPTIYPKDMKKSWEIALVNPIILLEKSKYFFSFLKLYPDYIFDYSLSEWSKKFSPICFLSECTKSCCEFNRTKSDIRRKFEDVIVEKIKLTKPDKSQKLTYLSYKPHNFFQDCIILTKLVEAGYTLIDIIFIDIQYTEFIEFHNSSQKKTTSKFWMLQYQIFQMLLWLNQKGAVTISLFDYSKAYSLNIKPNYFGKADIIVAADCVSLKTFDYDISEIQSLKEISLDSNGIFCELLSPEIVEKIKKLPSPEEEILGVLEL